jgi:hypothetical protein
MIEATLQDQHTVEERTTVLKGNADMSLVMHARAEAGYSADVRILRYTLVPRATLIRRSTAQSQHRTFRSPVRRSGACLRMELGLWYVVVVLGIVAFLTSFH